MARRILLGDEAIALAAVHSGITGAYAYPGTPSTEIMESLQKMRGEVPNWTIEAHWTANEKTSYEAAMGHSYAGRRTLVSFKHVGLNVAMDPFMSSAITGAYGGMVCAVADDPGMHSSQSEQDSRFLSYFAQIPCLEPWDQQTAYDWTRMAYDLSEEFGLPTMIRLVTRLAHSRASIEVGEPVSSFPSKPAVSDWHEWTLLPSNARPNYERLLDKQELIVERLKAGPFFELNEEGDPSYGIIATGLARNYVLEAFSRYDVQHPLLTIGAYPVPDDLIHRMFDMCDCVLFVEEGMPFLERTLQAARLTDKETFKGRLTGDLPRTGELTPELVAGALGADLKTKGGAAVLVNDKPLPVVARPPQLCQGCSHIDVFHSLSEVLEGSVDGRVFGDIGCYTLAALPPYDTMHTCVDMGASIPMAIGASQAGLRPAVSVIGDSTFTHSGLTGLVDAVNLNANIIVIISDNSTTAMTGGQPNIATREELVRIVEGLGVDPDHVHFIDANKAHRDEMTETIRREAEFDGPSVLVCSRPCIHNAARDKKVEPKKSTADQPKAKVPTTEPRPVASGLTRNLVLAGVGGQGILTIAQAIGHAATDLNLHVKQAETHGMSQRGGAVISHMRYSTEPVYSDLVQEGGADLLLAVEPLEALRWLKYLSPDGNLVVNVKPVKNVPNYPELEEVLGVIHRIPGHTLIDADRLASLAGSARSANMVLVGAASPMLGFDDDQWERTLRKIWSAKGERVVETNLKAFRYGRDAGLFFDALVKGGLDPHEALVVASHTEPSPEALSFVGAWFERLREAGGSELLAMIHDSSKALSFDPDRVAENQEQPQ